jgi:hypothetical protein
MTIIKLFYPNVEYRPYSQLYELHQCSCFWTKSAYPYEEDLAKYGIDASKLSEETTTELLDS